MQYSLFVISQEAGDAEVDEEAMEWGRKAFDAYAKSLDAAGVLVSADMLEPVAAAATVRVRDGESNVDHGPFSDAKNRLNGTFVIEVADLDAALDWAEKCPAALYGAVEIRPSAIIFRDGEWHSPAGS